MTKAKLDPARGSVLQFRLLEDADIPNARAFLGSAMLAFVVFGILIAGAMLGRARAESGPRDTTSLASVACDHPREGRAEKNPAVVPAAVPMAPDFSPKLVAVPNLMNATDAILRAFQTHDIVMFGEVHGSKQEYEWLCDLVRTPDFGKHVNDIVVEFGNARYQKVVDRYVAGDEVPFDEVQKAWRNMVASVVPVSPVNGWLYRAVRDANQKHPNHRIRIVMGSPPADWSKIQTAIELAPYESQREQWYAHQVTNEVLAKHDRALLIMGAGHLLRGEDQALHDEIAIQQHRPVPPLDRERLRPGYIEHQLRAAGADPYLVVLGSDAIDERGDIDPRLASWPVPVIVSLAGNWVGDLPAGPVLSDGHAPATPLSLANEADAMLYVASCRALRVVYPARAETEGTAYGKEMVRRDKLLIGRALTFPYGTVAQCAQPARGAQ